MNTHSNQLRQLRLNDCSNLLACHGRAPAASAPLPKIKLTGSRKPLNRRKRSGDFLLRMEELPTLHYSATPSLRSFVRLGRFGQSDLKFGFGHGLAESYDSRNVAFQEDLSQSNEPFDSHAILCILYAFDGQAQNIPREPDHTHARHHVPNWQLRTLRVHSHCRDFIAPLAIIRARMEYFYISAVERILV